MSRFPRPFPLATALFFLSGALGLGYELIWIKKAALVVGASQIAMSTVLTSFFLGIGLGSYFVGRYLRSSRWSPLFVYGLFEIAIGGFALAFPWLFELLELTYGGLHGVVSGSAIGLFLLRFLLLFVLCLVPTFFMGGTLPLLLDGLVDRDRSIGSRTSFLYGVNILGAVAGVLVTCYFAIPLLGMNGTSIAGGFGNLAIGAFALLAFRGLRPVHPREEAASLSVFFPAIAFASGLLAIAYQICWARYFTLFNTATVYLTAILLAVYLFALATGSFLLAPLLHARWNPLRVLGVVQALVPLATLYTLEWWLPAKHRMAILGRTLPSGRVVAVDTLELDIDSYWQFFSENADTTFFAPLFQVALVIFLPVTLLGIGLPAIIAAAVRHSAGLRSVAGRVVFWNTLGSSAGGFIAGYGLIPLIRLHWTLFAVGAGSVALSAFAFHRASRTAADAAGSGTPKRRRRDVDPKPSGKRWLWAFTAVGLAACMTYGLSIFDDFDGDVTRYTIRNHGYGDDPGATEMELVDSLEDPLTSSFVMDDEFSVRMGSGNVCLAVAYKRGISTQAIQGHIPALFFPGGGSPENCLGICLGSGQSFGALLMYPGVRSLDVVDISPGIVDLSLKHFGPYNHGLGDDERVRFHLDDGRHFVERAPDGFYDVVSMEPPPPTVDGVYSLYSLEFYDEVKRVLRPRGVFMQWLPLYRVTPLDARGIIKTQEAVFPETFVVMVGAAAAADFMVVSYASRPRFSLEAIRERCQVFGRERGVEGARWSPRRSRHDISSLEAVLSLLVMGPKDVRDMEGGLTYHDDNQILSYTSGDRWLLRRYEGPVLSALSYAALGMTTYEKITGGYHSLADYFDPPLSGELLARVRKERAASLSVFQVPDPDVLEQRAREYEAAQSPSAKASAAFQLAAAFGGALAKDEAFTWIDRGLRSDPNNREPENLRIVQSVVRLRLAVYRDLTRSWLEKLSKDHRGSLLVEAMQQELDRFLRRDGERLERYLFP